MRDSAVRMYRRAAMLDGLPLASTNASSDLESRSDESAAESPPSVVERHVPEWAVTHANAGMISVVGPLRQLVVVCFRWSCRRNRSTLDLGVTADEGRSAFSAKRSCFGKKHFDRKCLFPVRSGPFSFLHGAAFIDYGAVFATSIIE